MDVQAPNQDQMIPLVIVCIVIKIAHHFLIQDRPVVQSASEVQKATTVGETKAIVVGKGIDVLLISSKPASALRKLAHVSIRV
ncbi:unnamed protein product [Somion occarium]|uniref:Uncharacterized protein n=1 Tax=Somion occarium TaxID=3059160 RepID=A0ABP1CWP1_9APHY